MTERHPQFEALVDRARRQPAPPLTVTHADVRRASVRRIGWKVAVVSLAAALLLAIAWSSKPVAPREEAPPAAADRVPGSVSMHVIPDLEPVASAELLRLERGATLQRLEPGRPDSPTEGTFVVRTGDQGIALPIRGRVLEVGAASEVFVDDTLTQTTFEVRKGTARWASAAPSRERIPAAATLAARAERAMIAGERVEAIASLRQLVRHHPFSAPAKGALLDLARLEAQMGREARSHCAHALFLARFPRDARAPSVRTAYETSRGEATQCRGLRPMTR